MPLIIGALGDRHVSRRSPRYLHSLKVWDAAIADAETQGVTTWLGLGDVVEGQPDGAEYVELFARYHAMRTSGLVYEAQGNHEARTTLLPLGYLGVEVAAERTLFRDLGPACLLVLPYPHRGRPPWEHVPAGLGIAESMAAAVDLMRQAVETAGQLARRAGKPLIVAGHFTVAGMKTGDSEYELHAQHEPLVPIDALAPATLVLTGHVHKSQEIAPNVVGVGSLYRVSFGEVDDPPKSYTLVTIDDAGRVSWIRRPVPARKQIVEEHTWDALRTVLAERPDAIMHAVDAVRGAEVKWIVSIPEAQLATFDSGVFAPIKDAAALFTLEKRVIPTQRTRAPQLAEVHTLPAALGTWAAATGISFDDARRARVGAKCAELEG